MSNKILCFDQATKISGYSIWVNGQLKKYGTLLSNVEEKNPLERIKQMTDAAAKLIKQQKPDYVVMENIQFQQNIAGFKSLAQLQGSMMNVLNNLNIGYCFVEPSAWKSFCKIKGRKRDEQKRNTVIYIKEIFDVTVNEDEADAIGIGLWAVTNIIPVKEKTI